MDSEHRRDHREPIALEVRYPGLSARGCDYTDNVSSHGMFVLSGRRWPEDKQVHFVLSFPRLLDPIDLQGVVRWRRGGPDRGFGVEFLEPDATTRHRLEAFLVRVRDVPTE